MTKIEEGFVKKVDSLLIAKVAEARLDYLRRADKLLKSVRQGRGGCVLRLISRVALALESGLLEETLENALKKPSGRGGSGRTIRVIDAGVEMHSAGFNPEQTQIIMSDFLDRNLNGSEIARALDFLLKEHASGRDFQSIYQQLWVQPE